MENLTPREKQEIIKSAAKKRRRRRNKFSQIMAVLSVFLAFYLAITLFIAGSIYYSFNATAKNTEIYSLNVIYAETTLHKIEAQEANNEYGLYLPFSCLSDIGTFGLAGDGEDVTLFIIGSDNRIECTRNSSLVVINDNPIRISAPILYENGEYLIPIVLVENYINGIDVIYDNEKMVCSVANNSGKTNVELKLLLPEDMNGAYFPDEYKYYGDPNASEEPNT